MKKVVLILLFFIPISLFGIVWGNAVHLAFYPSSSGLSSGSTQLELLITQGAVQFLKSYSDYVLFLQIYEQNNSDNPALQVTLNNVIDNLKKANDTYLEIKYMAPRIPYNRGILTRLSAFNFTALQESRGLTPGIMDKVRFYFANGNITGAFSYTSKNTSKLLNKLTVLKRTLDQGMVPDINKLWDINQAYIDLMLFGQYESQVFKGI
ncbi:MAG: hypothetical protein ACM3SY_14560 [Candidatus Omnitrophota bacterium]